LKILKEESAPRYVRDEGIVSYLLASPLTCDSEHLTVSVVDIQPGGKQRIHNHEPEQVYFIITGGGLMRVAEDEARVGSGDCIFIPSWAKHGLENDGDIALRYFSAAAPSFDREQLKELWPLESKQRAVD
jgi:mannose-6-phosphate isomerase-like protein (cupin superfamily)